MTFRQMLRAAVLMATAIFSFLLGGCRLYEPPRYARLEFPAGAPRERVLFVGNSMTYYNDLPGLLQQLSAREAKPVQFEAITVPYASLEYHWGRGKAQELMAKESWDYVVLQDFSRKPATDPQNSTKYFELFDAEARKAGAKTIIFQNWTRKGYASEYNAMLSTYMGVRTDTGATIAPIGAAWEICAREHPEITMLVDDRHPTDAGTYLTACVLYGVIYGKDPTTLPMDLQGPKISAEQMKVLRTIAGAALREPMAMLPSKPNGIH